MSAASTGPPTISSLTFNDPASTSAAWMGCSMLPTLSPSATASFNEYSPGARLAPATYSSADGTPAMAGFSRMSAAWLSTTCPWLSVMT